MALRYLQTTKQGKQGKMASTQDYVYGELRRRLMAGAYVPGERLREEPIAAEFSVSRTPVRAAIDRLETDGLVKREGRRGALVLGWHERDINEVFELRLLLEPFAAESAALHASAEQIDEMERINNQMLAAVQANAEDRAAQVQHYNNLFHHALLNAGQSARVRAMVEGLLDMPIIIGSFYFYSTEDMLRSVEQHREIIAAVRAGDPRCTHAAVRFHLASTFLLFRQQRRPMA